MIVGGVMSFNVTTSAQVAVLPFPSLAVSVTVCAVLCPVRMVELAGDCVTAGNELQLSASVAAL